MAEIEGKTGYLANFIKELRNSAILQYLLVSFDLMSTWMTAYACLWHDYHDRRSSHYGVCNH